ncbi:MAG: pitrilysin family protein [Cyanobacteria bacterium P01_H01_bin.15]
MRNRAWWVLTLFTSLIVFSLRPAAAGTPLHYPELSFPALPEITLPNYERYVMPNGLVVYLLENHELPLVSGTALVRTGSRWEPPEKVGLAGLTGSLIRAGGTSAHPTDELNEALEARAASIEAAIGTAAGSVGFSALSEDLTEVLELFAEVLRTPAFDPEQLALAQVQTRGAIARRNDDPGDITSREFAKLIYGDDSPYARTVEYETLDNIQRDDLINFHQRYFRPGQTILGIYGDFDSPQVKSLLSQTLGDWSSSNSQVSPRIPPAEMRSKPGIYVVDQPQLTQSNVRMGHLGGELDSPDYPALSVMNEVLNGFGGRLFNELRSRQGLAYSIFGVWSARYDYPGVFFAGGQTRSEATVPLIAGLQKEIARLRTKPISQEELALAKESILNSFVFNFDQPQEVLSRLLRYEYYGYPLDFLFQYQQQVKNTTVQDIQRVAQKYLKPNQLITLVVGSEEQIQSELNELSQPVLTRAISD